MKSRLVVLVAVVLLWSVAIGWRLYALQVTDHAAYRAKAERQQRADVELEPPRGTIYDARGRELAVSAEVDSAWADPRQIADPAAAAAALTAAARAHGLSLDRADLERRLGEDRGFVWVARQLDRPQAAALAALELPGLGFVKEHKRYYPMGPLAAQVLGYAGIDQRGLAGLEHVHDELVAGEEGRRVLLRDAHRGTALALAVLGAEPRPGASLRLTLDAAVQHIAERELARAVREANAAGGSVVLLDPATGAVLAMASYPTFDLNRFPESPESAWRNRPVMDAYEPGSTFKIFTAAAALAANRLDPSDEMDCEMGAIRLAGVRIRDHKPFGVLTLRDVIARSSNVGAIKTGLAAGEERLYAMIRAFGFGRPTGIDLPAESSGVLAPLEAWHPITKAYVSFGQGLAVTPLQMAAAYGAIANGGTLWRPYVVAAVEEPDGSVHRTVPEVVGRPVTEATARELERMLEAVVSEGTGRAAAIAGFPVAGKTGTAQKAVGRGYSATQFVAGFTGFAPARRPLVVGAVAIDEPWPRYHGGEVAAPAFARIVEPVLLYLGSAPERGGGGGEPFLGGPMLARLDARASAGGSLAELQAVDLDGGEGAAIDVELPAAGDAELPRADEAGLPAAPLAVPVPAVRGSATAGSAAPEPAADQEGAP
ncbi:MAG TPA: penicillin-binding protein 2 [Thermoanaerobaculia bacterium]|nr:penicillin-binding protein 2 [Thermoanaerobaculia bacterium]